MKCRKQICRFDQSFRHRTPQRSRSCPLWSTSETTRGWKVTAVTVPAHLRVSLLPQKQNTRGQNVGLVWPPQPESPGSRQGGREPRIRALLLLHKYRRGRGSCGELTQGFHPVEAHFRGMWLFLHLDRSPGWALCGGDEPRIDRLVLSDAFVLLWPCASVRSTLRGPDTAVGRSGRIKPHMAFSYNPNISPSVYQRGRLQKCSVKRQRRSIFSWYLRHEDTWRHLQNKNY